MPSFVGKGGRIVLLRIRLIVYQKSSIANQDFRQDQLSFFCNTLSERMQIPNRSEPCVDDRKSDIGFCSIVFGSPLPSHK